MSLLEALRVALISLLANKSRSLLTMLGIIIGVGAVIAVVAIGEGLKTDVLDRIGGLGTNLLTVMPGAGRGFGPVTRPGRLTDDDLEMIARRLRNVAALAPTTTNRAEARYGNRSHSTQILGTTADWPDARNFAVDHGRFFNAAEERGRARVAVVGSTVAEELFYGRPLLGEIIRIQGTPFEVIGFLEEKGGFGNPDDQIVIPLETARARLFGRDGLTSILVSAASPEHVDQVTESLTQVLRQAHRLRPGQEDDFRIMSQAELLATMTETGQMITQFLGGIALVSLLVGGVGIMNIMLVSVTERTREIGIRKAVGARNRDILLQFLIESVLLSVLGGLIGMSLGIGLATLLSRVLGWATLVSPAAVALAFLFAAGVGIFFGFYPARKAAMLDPIDCLRYE